MALQLKQLPPEILKIRSPVRVKEFLAKQDHRKKFYELCLKSIGQIPQLEDPTDEQLEWVGRRMSRKTWNTAVEHKPWIVGRWYIILEDYDQNE